MEHNYDSDVDFLLKKEQLINFINHFEINKETKVVSPLSVYTCIKFFEDNLEKCANSNSLKKIKEIFRLNKNKRDYLYTRRRIFIKRPETWTFRSHSSWITDYFIGCQ